MEWGNRKELEQVFGYFKSDENLRKCQPFVDECKRLGEKAKDLNENYRAIYDEIKANVKKEEYSVGGETIHRGFYNPSPVIDIVLKNANRGKLLKRMTSKSKPVHKYMFDDFGDLILIYNFPLHLECKEIIIRQNETETGIAFDKSGIRTISECVYRGNQILSYIFCLYSTYENRIVEYTKEDFKCSEPGLSDVSIGRFLNSPEALILRQEKYRFKHDMEGYLSQYSIVEKDDGISKSSEWADCWVDIKIKRKV